MANWQLEFDIHLEMTVSDVAGDVDKLYRNYINVLKQRMIDIPGRETIKGKVFSLEGAQQDEMEM